MSRLFQVVIRALQAVGARTHPRAGHLLFGERGETEAYFYLKDLGYRFVATNFRVPHNRGEIDLIGWDNGVLCFVEVKARTDDSYLPPSSAVTLKKQRNILSVARRYLRGLPGERFPAVRFDIVSIVPSEGGKLAFNLKKGAFTWDAGEPHRRRYREFYDRSSGRR
jgi:putative endonuclease